MRCLVFLFLFSSLAFAGDKADTFFQSCRHSSMTTLMNIIEAAKDKYKELDSFSLDKCTKLKNIRDMMKLWDDMKDPKFEGCTWGVDAALGQSPADDQLRKKFKVDLCL